MITKFEALVFPLARVSRTDTGPFIGIQTLVKPTSMKGSGLVKQAKGSGWHIQGDQKTSWPLQGYDQWEDQLLGLGPFPPGFVPLDWQKGPRTDQIASLLTLARTFFVLDQQKILPERMSPYQFYPGAQGDCLVLHTALSHGLEGIFPENLSQEAWPYIHPDLTGPESFSFFLASYLWRILSEKSPYSHQDSLEVHDNIRETRLPKAAEFFLQLPQTIGDLLDSALSPRGSKPTLQQWADALAPLDSDFWAAHTSAETLQTRVLHAEAHLQKDQKRRKVKSFFLKNRLALSLSGIAFLFLAFFFGSWIVDLSAKSPYVELTPTEVVTHYYNAMDQLQDQIMRKLVIPWDAPPFAKNDTDTVTQLYIFTAARGATMGEEGLVRAQEWRDQPDLTLPPGHLVWGLLDLNIEPVSFVRFSIQYIRVYSYTNQGERIWETYRHNDQISVKPTDNGYKIHQLTRSVEFVDLLNSLQ